MGKNCTNTESDVASALLRIRRVTVRRHLVRDCVSLPELVFANIRKGSNDWIPKEHRSLDPVVVEDGQVGLH